MCCSRRRQVVFQCVMRNFVMKLKYSYNNYISKKFTLFSKRSQNCDCHLSHEHQYLSSRQNQPCYHSLQTTIQIIWFVASGGEETHAVPRMSTRCRGRGSAQSPECLALTGRAQKMLMLLMLLTQAKQNKTPLHGSKPSRAAAFWLARSLALCRLTGEGENKGMPGCSQTT